ncbi:MAG: efflux transporter outer membrane subunit [Lewinellaceae bacterium]|nr:efflux transporter outer membrane subunit [Lewinellaceae bacterium]
MSQKIIIKISLLILISSVFHSCKVPTVISKQENTTVPDRFVNSSDTVNMASHNWSTFFKDQYLIELIDTALQNNRELNITLQELEMGNNEIKAREGEYLPFLRLGAATVADRAGKYTWDGFSEEDLKDNPERGPIYIGDFMAKADFTWELDAWKKLRNAKKAAVYRYLASVEGKNFLVTNLVSEIASSYFELIALDNLLGIIERNINIQSNALSLVQAEKDVAKATLLAVNRFQAQLINTENLQYEIRQQIIETENKINLLVGRFPQHIARDTSGFLNKDFENIRAGVPSQLLANRPDVKEAMLQLEASKMDVESTRANFYPSIQLKAGLGLQAFNPIKILNPESILYNIGGDLIAPLINKNAIKAEYFNANLKQIQAVYQYEQSILNAHIEVVNQLNAFDNYSKSFKTKQKEVEILNNSVVISNELFKAARADYIEVLLTQREALESTIELMEIKSKQLGSVINLYKALGGGWK